MSGWSELPSEIIHTISQLIDNPFDLIHFRSICSRWRSCSLQTFPPIPSLRFPLPPGKCFDYLHILEISHPRLLIDFLNSQVIELAQEHVACYTFECDQSSDSFYPSPSKFELSISFLPLDAENKDFMVLGRLYFKCLGMYKSIEDRWTEIETTLDSSPDGIILFKGHFYVIDSTGVTKVIKSTLESYSFRRSRPCDKTRNRWFVKVEDKLLLVEMCTDNIQEYDRPHLLAEKGWFEVSELNKERNDWIQEEDVGGCILFLDKGCSFSCSHEQVPGFRPNSVIFDGMFGNYGHQVFEFGVQGFRPLGDIPQYCPLSTSNSSRVFQRVL